MELNDPVAKMIRAACTKRIIDVTDKKSNPKFLENVRTKAKKYYENPDDNRSFEKVLGDTMVGELGEHAIFDICSECGLDTVHNEEDISRQFYWDIAVEDKLIEIKYQSHPFYFGFDKKSKDRHMYENWHSIDLIIGFYLKEKNNRTFVIPWMLVDPSAINPKMGYYVDSIQNEGRYLRDRAKELGLAVEINVNKNKFNFLP